MVARPGGQNKVRIGGGTWRSRLLTFPDAPGLRPTPERVRQTLFNWLGQDLHGLRCLDLFSGTGVMGFEALSRGAAEAVMVEKSLPAYQALRANQAALQAVGARIQHADALQFLFADRKRYDVIFLDPPYNQGWLEKLLPEIGVHLADDGYVYAEAEYALQELSGWELYRQGKAGNVYYHLLKLANDS